MKFTMSKEYDPYALRSGYESDCKGAIHSDVYVTAPVLSGGVTHTQLSHVGSTMLEEIVSFDAAEVKDANLGQINAVVVSSFCGPESFLWGYDLVKSENGLQTHPYAPRVVSSPHGLIPIYSLRPLREASKALFGVVPYARSTRFPIHPGSIVPCALKTITKHGPTCLYSALGIGISVEDSGNAYLFMEDVGSFPNGIGEKEKETILTTLSESIVEIGSNHGIIYKEILVDVESIIVEENQTGTALLAIPYILLPQKALFNSKGRPYPLDSMTLEEWASLTTV